MLRARESVCLTVKKLSIAIWFNKQAPISMIVNNDLSDSESFGPSTTFLIEAQLRVTEIDVNGVWLFKVLSSARI